MCLSTIHCLKMLFIWHSTKCKSDVIDGKYGTIVLILVHFYIWVLVLVQFLFSSRTLANLNNILLHHFIINHLKLQFYFLNKNSLNKFPNKNKFLRGVANHFHYIAFKNLLFFLTFRYVQNEMPCMNYKNKKEKLNQVPQVNIYSQNK